MSVKKRGGLGSRGRELLIGSASIAKEQPPTKEGLKQLPVEYIRRGKYQPRSHFDADALEELASSITAQGMVQPIVVRSIGVNSYEIIAGERRWRAAQLAGLTEVPSIVREVDDQSAVAMALIENIQRESLNPIEEATALDRLIDEFELTHQGAAEAVGRSRAAVSNLLRLLDLTDHAKGLVEDGSLEMGHARAILTLDHKLQAVAVSQVIKKGLSVRETEALVRKLKNPAAEKPKKSHVVDHDIERLQESLTEKLGAKVLFQHGAKGAGKLTIQYHSIDELDGILSRIR